MSGGWKVKQDIKFISHLVESTREDVLSFGLSNDCQGRIVARMKTKSPDDMQAVKERIYKCLCNPPSAQWVKDEDYIKKYEQRLDKSTRYEKILNLFP